MIACDPGVIIGVLLFVVVVQVLIAALVMRKGRLSDEEFHHQVREQAAGRALLVELCPRCTALSTAGLVPIEEEET